ncbi:MAG TPA: hypothetical protein VGI91_01050 [Steroidobacteraceae bacterium]|jgi:hypothetical protein
MSQIVRSLVLGAAVLALGACSSTTFTSTWKAPGGTTINPAGKTVAAVFVTRDEGKRRAGEDAMARDLTERGAHGVPGYTILPENVRADADKARALLREAGVNAVVISRMVGKDQQINYTPGTSFPTYYGGFGPYWGHGWGAAYDPGYLTTDTYVSIETTVYSLPEDKLLWASTSRTANPSNIDTLVNEVADATAKEMKKQGFLPP